jgi:hypothetical protein
MSWAQERSLLGPGTLLPSGRLKGRRSNLRPFVVLPTTPVLHAELLPEIEKRAYARFWQFSVEDARRRPFPLDQFAQCCGFRVPTAPVYGLTLPVAL